MSNDARRNKHLAKAREAEAQAEKVRDPNIRAQWLKIAEAYRQLAKTT